MKYTVDASKYEKRPVYGLGKDFTGTSPEGRALSFTNASMTMDGSPFFAVSGEIHFSRMDPARWEDELIKMRMGGVNIVSTYVFWNHVEEEEGVFDFSGRRDVRRFVNLCRKHGLYVILRIGPFCHGEARNGGLPDWLYAKPFEVRTVGQGFMGCVRRLYGRIGEETGGLYYRDGGPIIGVQLDNEYMHAGAMWETTLGVSGEWIPAGSDGEEYMLSLRDAALAAGIRPAFFTATAWGGAAYSPRLLPLWGGYAYRPWIFYSHRGEHPATEEYVYEDYCRKDAGWADDFSPAYDPETRPYACCEMGAGMMCCYNYRFIYPYRSVDALANIKLGSGCNFIGYYMFHGGTNPRGKRGAFLNESQVTKISYDYQAALGEFGQERLSYRRLKALHFFTRFWGDRLAAMQTVLPEGASDIDPRDTATLRFALRTDGESGFLFVNQFQDHLEMPEKRNQEVEVILPGGKVDFRFDIAPEENAILPIHMDMEGIRLIQANAQPVLKTSVRGRTVYVLMTPEGMDGRMTFEDGARVKRQKESGPEAEMYTVEKGDVSFDVLLLSRGMGEKIYLLRDGSLIFTEEALLEDEKGTLRLETEKAESRIWCYPPERLAYSPACEREDDLGPLGGYAVRTAPRSVGLAVTEGEGYRYVLTIDPEDMEGLKDARLEVDYAGDMGLLFWRDQLIHDNFANGDTWEIGLAEHREALGQGPLTLVIKPIREGAVVKAETAMAARSEEARDVKAALHGIRIQSVYQIGLD